MGVDVLSIDGFECAFLLHDSVIPVQTTYVHILCFRRWPSGRRGYWRARPCESLLLFWNDMVLTYSDY